MSDVSKRFQFWLGTAVIVLILGMILFPGLFTSSNPYATEGMRSYVDDSGTFHLEKAPFHPQWGIPMGTDELGRQVWALIVYGTRLTMTLAFLIVLFRFMLALPFGFFAGFGSLSAHGAIDKLSRFFGTIPTLLLCIIILKMDFFTGLTKNFSILAFVILLGFVGFGKLGLMVEERVTAILREPFVTGDVAIGKNRFQIAGTTVLRHFLPELIVLFFLEFARVLTLLMQLGLFAVFVGNVRFIEDSSNGIIKYMDISYEPEWASMLGAARNNLRSAPWLVLFPALAFFISVLGLNAFGEGLRDLQSGAIKRPKIGRKMRAGLALFLVAVLAVQGVGYLKKTTGFSLESFSYAPAGLEDGPVMIGTQNGQTASEAIAAALSERGFSPLSGQMIQTYEAPAGAYTIEGRLVLAKSADRSDSVDVSDDVWWIAHGDYETEGVLLDMREADLYQLTEDRLEASVSGGEKPILLLDAAFYSDAAVVTISERLSEFESVGGMVWLTDADAMADKRETQLTLDVPALYVDRVVFESAPDAHYAFVNQTSGITGTTGRNVYAMMPGTDPYAGEEAIIYGFGYNAASVQDAEEKINFAFSVIDEVTKSPSNRKRTVIVLFLDGTLSDATHGILDYASKSLYPQKDVLLYLDLTRIETAQNELGTVLLDQRQSPISRYYAYTFSLQLEGRLDQANIVHRGIGEQTDIDQLLYLEKGFPTLSVGLSEGGTGSTGLETLGSVLTTVIKSNNY